MIQVTDVTKWYGTIRAVENISFSLAPGEIVGFVGPNGAGKSTVLKMLATYLLPTSGKITIDGLDVVDASLVHTPQNWLPLWRHAALSSHARG